MERPGKLAKLNLVGNDDDDDDYICAVVPASTPDLPSDMVDTVASEAESRIMGLLSLTSQTQLAHRVQWIQSALEQAMPQTAAAVAKAREAQPDSGTRLRLYIQVYQFAIVEDRRSGRPSARHPARIFVEVPRPTMVGGASAVAYGTWDAVFANAITQRIKIGERVMHIPSFIDAVPNLPVTFFAWLTDNFELVNNVLFTVYTNQTRSSVSFNFDFSLSDSVHNAMLAMTCLYPHALLQKVCLHIFGNGEWEPASLGAEATCGLYFRDDAVCNNAYAIYATSELHLMRAVALWLWMRKTRHIPVTPKLLFTDLERVYMDWIMATEPWKRVLTLEISDADSTFLDTHAVFQDQVLPLCSKMVDDIIRHYRGIHGNVSDRELIRHMLVAANLSTAVKLSWDVAV